MSDILKSEPADEALTRSNGQFNRSAIKRHAMKVSRQTRNGKFTRVSAEFIDNVIAQTEARLRAMGAPLTNAPLGQVEPDEDAHFLTGEGRKRLQAAFNVWIAREIHRQVNGVRVGATL